MRPSARVRRGEMRGAGGADEAGGAYGQFKTFQSFQPFQSFPTLTLAFRLMPPAY